MSEASEVLPGGGQNYGRVLLKDGVVVRPVGTQSPAVQAFLRHLRTRGFEGAPEVVGSSPQLERLSFIEGDVPQPPEPPAGGWPVVSDSRAASVGDPLQRFHAAARGFVPPEDARWKGGRTSGLEHSLVCHNDPVVGNVVFRGASAVALIDFDFAGPNDPLRDLAIAASTGYRWPIRATSSAPPSGLQPNGSTTSATPIAFTSTRRSASLISRSAVTAAASQAAIDAGANYVVLYTDLANPTSNAMYQALGYVEDHDAEERDFVV